MEINGAFKRHLQNEFAKRVRKNERFSIRAFAKQLGLEPSSLAQLLSGKRRLTDSMCLRIAGALALSPSKIQNLMRREYTEKGEAFTGFKKIQDDAFRVISDWQYYAILELTRTKEFKADLHWIARSLGISIVETRAAVERLQRLGYLKIQADGRWMDALGSAENLGNRHTSAALRNHQKQILKKATQALDDVAYEERVQSSMVLSGSKERVAEAKRRILNFIEELDEFMKSGETRDEVYAISVSLFPLSKTQNDQKSQGVSHE